MRTRVCAFLLALAVSAAPALGAVVTAKYSLTNSGWTDLGVGPLLLGFNGTGVFAIGDTTPTLVNEGFGVRPGRSKPLKTTSHVWATATGAFGAVVYAAPISGGSNPLIPVNSVAPVASGSLTVGSTLSCTTGTWTNSPTSYAYQWLRGGSSISGATSATYLTVTADGGTSVGCSVKATNAGGSSAFVASNTLAIAAAGGCAQATNYLSRTTGGNEGGNAANTTTLICGLVTDGVITGNLNTTGCGKFDVFYVMAQQNRNDALLNLCGTGYTLIGTLRGSDTPAPKVMSFISYQGFFGNIADYMNTIFDPSTAPSPHFTRNNAGYGYWSYAIISEAGCQVGQGSSATANAIYQVFTDDGVFYEGINSTDSPGVPSTITKGLSSGDRSDAANVYLYQNGVASGPIASPSRALESGYFTIGACNSAGVGSAQTFSEFHAGGALSSALELALYNRLRTYMTAVGVP